MPLTKKGATILAAMTRQNNGDRKAAEREFYASINSGRIKGAEAAPSRPRPTKK
ncbi:MAG TPA: hypothetical protein VGR70_20850 [Stellaceae bacterium]|nr:hypothetical protein [Stellaceae bacterium]